jgi:hypothetical protein
MPVDHLVEPHAIGLVRFRQQDDLPSVHGEVLDDVIDCLEHAHVVRLDESPRLQVGGGQRREYAVDVRDRLLQPIDQRRDRERRSLVELRLAVSHIARAADTTHDPLPCVAGEVEQQVADAVRPLVRPGPDDVLVEHGDRKADLREVFAQVTA